MVEAFAAHPRYGQAEAEVEQVVFATATTADVSYMLSLRGQPLPAALDNTVLQDGHWKVSVPTFCALAQVAGDIPLPPDAHEPAPVGLAVVRPRGGRARRADPERSTGDRQHAWMDRHPEGTVPCPCSTVRPFQEAGKDAKASIEAAPGRAR
ncbi:hypothetical protein [Streptomyces peucetius]|nr:hypothetical protein CGZ69_35710 [Streptomyces peucetius subsp. caesius ATCC 27952]